MTAVSDTMTIHQLERDLARVTHELWRARLEAEGWTPGPYAPQEKHHDALVPYERLSRADKLVLNAYVQAEELACRIPAQLSYPRGPDRPLLVEDLRPGLGVVFCAQGCPRCLSAVAPEHRGVVVSWETDSDDELTLITVRWNSGEIQKYDPWSGEIARAEELQQRAPGARD